MTFLVFSVKCDMWHIYGPFFTGKTSMSHKIPWWHLFLFSSYFRTHTTTLLLKILGGRMHGPSPSQIWGAVPSGLRLCLHANICEFI